MKTTRWNSWQGTWRAVVAVAVVGAILSAGRAQGQEASPAATSQPAEEAVAPAPPAEAEAVAAPLAAAETAATSRPAAQVDEKRLADLWDNFLHGIKVAREDLALSTGQAILDTGAARQVYLLSVKEADTQWLLTRGEGLHGLKPVIDDIRKMIEAGYNAERSDSTQIAHAIDLLAENLRAYELGASRLVQSGEYAMPQLVQKLTDQSTSVTLTERVISVLPRIGKNAVRPLSATLVAKDQGLLQIAAEALGRIRYAEATAALKEMLRREDLVDRTRQVATAALVACGGEGALNTPVASLLYEQAEKYYYNRQSVPLDPNSPTANVWSWREGLGLTYRTVPKDVFGDIYAMRLARAALEYDPTFHPAVSLWLAAKMRLEIHSPPPGGTEPNEGPSARFYALAGSVAYLQDVLGRALRDGDPALALRAIDALAETAGAKSLVEPATGGVQPLVEALGNRNREVRLMAALALANALPREHFKGDDRVMAVLNEALRQRGRRKALLIDADPAEQNLLQDALRSAGYEVVSEPVADKAIQAARQTGGVDLVVLGAKPDPADFLVRMRNEPTLMALPVVVAYSDERLRRLAADDGGIVLTKAGVDAASASEAFAQATKTASTTAPTAEQTASWAVRAADVIARLGRTGNPVFDVAQTATMLTSALADPQADVAVAAARALAAMSAPQAQQALADRALMSSLGEPKRVELLKLLASSLRRFGNLLSEAQANAIIAVVTDTKQPQALREAAAQVLGAMNLPSEKFRGLIVGEGS